jgi:hypothetical protein
MSFSGGFVHRVDLTNPSGTPTIARRWLALANGELVWRYGHEQLLEEAAAVSRSISQSAEPQSNPSTLSIKTGNKLHVELFNDTDKVAPWVLEATERFDSEKRDFALSPLKSPLSTHKSFVKLSPLVSPSSVRSLKRAGASGGSSLAISTARNEQSPTSRRRRRADTTSWDSPLRGAGSTHDVLSVAELALSVVTQEASVTCCTEQDAAEYMEARETRERLRKAAREADRPMPRFEALALKTSHCSYVLRVVLGAPDSAGDNAYNLVVSEAAELDKWRKALEAGTQYAKVHSYWEERLRELTSSSNEVNARVAHWKRSLSKSQAALDEAGGASEILQEACMRGEELAEWSVESALARAEQNQAKIRADVLMDVPNRFWPGLLSMGRRVASMQLMEGQSVA